MSAKSDITDIVNKEANVKDKYSSENFKRNKYCMDSGEGSEKRYCKTFKKPMSSVEEDCVKKFIIGEPIIDKQNPFKTAHGRICTNNIISHGAINETASFSQKIRRDEFRCNSKSLIYKANENPNSDLHNSISDDFITTEEVLKQSKYVKTYIKNPDPYFIYDPSILIRLQSELLKEADKSKTRNKITDQSQKRSKEIVKDGTEKNERVTRGKQLHYKKCSKPNYPDLSEIKVKVGTKLDGIYVNPTEVKSNVKKFDECVKKIEFHSDDDSEEIEESLTRTYSGEMNTMRQNGKSLPSKDIDEGLYSKTINSKSFQRYLERMGLMLIPISMDRKNDVAIRPPAALSCKIEDCEDPSNVQRNVLHISSMKALKKIKKSSIFHRLLLNNLFLPKRRTTPTQVNPLSRNIYNIQQDAESIKLDVTCSPSRRIVLMSKEDDCKYHSVTLQKDADSKECSTSESKHQKIKVPSSDSNSLIKQKNITGLQKDAKIKILKSEKGVCMCHSIQFRDHDFSTVDTLSRSSTFNCSEYTCNRPRSREYVTKEKNITLEDDGKVNTKVFYDIKENGNVIINNRNEKPNETTTSATVSNSLRNGWKMNLRPFTKFSRDEWILLGKYKKNSDQVKRKSNAMENTQSQHECAPLWHMCEESYSQPIYSTVEQKFHSAKEGKYAHGKSNGSLKEKASLDDNCEHLNVSRTASVSSSEGHRRSELERNQTEQDHDGLIERKVMRGNQLSRTSINTMTREEIIQKVKQFCWNAMKEKPQEPLERNRTQSASTLDMKISPVSYDSVDTRQSVTSLSNTPPPSTKLTRNFTANEIRNPIRSSWCLNGIDASKCKTFQPKPLPSSNNLYRYKNMQTFGQTDNKKKLYDHVMQFGSNFICEDETVVDSKYLIPLMTPQGSYSFPTVVPLAQLQSDQCCLQYTPLRHNNDTECLMWCPPIIALQRDTKELRMEGLENIIPTKFEKEDWQNENKPGRQQSNDQVNDERRRSSRREDPRRHTLGADMLQYSVMQNQSQQRAMDLENQPIVRSYVPINQGPLFDEDPGIMSEVETASTGFRRGGKQRSSLPVVRTPSKTLERPLGLVFLQYRSETKRALLPNEITSIDTVRALFVRSFPRQLTMAYLEGPNVKIYIHDASKDMFYELEDVRSHLREIRDRSVLRLFESNEVAAPPQFLPGGTGIPQPVSQVLPIHWDQDQSYFSEPEFDSEYQHQHIHKSKPGKQPPYYVGTSQTLPRGMYSDRNKVSIDGYTSSPERGTRGSYEEPYYSQYGTRGAVVAPIIDEENSEVALSEDQYAIYGMKIGHGRMPRTANQMYDPTRPEDLHRIRVEHMERQLANLTGLVQKALVNQNPQITPAPVATLASNYLGVPAQCRDKSVSFEKSVSFSDDIQGAPKSHSPQHAADSKPTKPAIKSSTLPRTSSQERDRLKPPPPPKPIALTQAHSNYRADIALAPEVYNHLRGLQKKAKDLRMEMRTLRRLSQAQAVAVREDIKDAFMRIRATLLASSGNCWDQHADQEKTRISREEELYKQEVIRLEKDLSDLESSVEGLRGEVINRRTRVNMAAVEDMALVLSRASKTVAELKLRFPGLSNGVRNILSNEMEKVVREEKFLKEEPDRLESALRRCKKLTGTLVTLKRLASVQEQRLPPTEPINNEDPPRSAEISAANKPTPSPRMGAITIGGGVPPENALDALLDELQTFAKPINQINELRPENSISDDNSQTILSTVTTQIPQACLYNSNEQHTARTIDDTHEPAATATAATAATATATVTVAANNIPYIQCLNVNNNLQLNSNAGILRRLHSYTSCSDPGDAVSIQNARMNVKPPVPERNAELLSKMGGKRIPPPPPPRTSSRSPLASPTSPKMPPRLASVCEMEASTGNGGLGLATQDGSDNGNGSGSGPCNNNECSNDQMQRQAALERRHQELLRKQKMLQEQYLRLQQMSKIPAATMPPPVSDIAHLKKTGSESNLPQKMGLCMSTVSGSMKNLNTENSGGSASIIEKNEKNEKNLTNTSNVQLIKQQLQDISNAGGPPPISSPRLPQNEAGNSAVKSQDSTATNTIIKQVYETEIL